METIKKNFGSQRLVWEIYCGRVYTWQGGGSAKKFQIQIVRFLTQHFSNHLGHTLTLSTSQEASSVKPLYLAQICQCLNSLCLCFDDEPNAPQSEAINGYCRFICLNQLQISAYKNVFTQLQLQTRLQAGVEPKLHICRLSSLTFVYRFLTFCPQIVEKL